MTETDWQERLMLKAFRLLTVLRLERILHVGGSARPFADYFKGMERVEAVRRIFGEKTEEVLGSVRVEFTWFGGYMFVDGRTGHILINSRYLNEGDRLDVYLDLIHELVHVRQFMEGKELFDSAYSYTERPTEVEAYGYAVEAARELGLSDERICRYLKTEWMSEESLQRLARALKVDCSERSAMQGDVGG